jgi:glucokinase
MKYAIGVDLGGTNIKVVAIAHSRELLLQTATETGNDNRLQWTENVSMQIKAVESKIGYQANWVGLASPGIVARDGRSMACVCGQLKDITGFDWADFLQPHLPKLLNDAHAALLGEVSQGAAKGCKDAMLITLGTGVGGAVLTNGRLLRGNVGRGGHFGHLYLSGDCQTDSFSVPLTLEEAIGNRTVENRSGGLFKSTEQLVNAYSQGDETAHRIWLKSVYQLACGIASFINIADPEIIIIGGGIARAGDALFVPLAEYLEKLEWRPQGFQVPVVPALLGSIAGAVGAASNAMEFNTAEGNQILAATTFFNS